MIAYERDQIAADSGFQYFTPSEGNGHVCCHFDSEILLLCRASIMHGVIDRMHKMLPLLADDRDMT